MITTLRRDARHVDVDCRVCKADPTHRLSVFQESVSVGAGASGRYCSCFEQTIRYSNVATKAKNRIVLRAKPPAQSALAFDESPNRTDLSLRACSRQIALESRALAWPAERRGTD